MAESASARHACGAGGARRIREGEVLIYQGVAPKTGQRMHGGRTEPSCQRHAICAMLADDVSTRGLLEQTEKAGPLQVSTCSGRSRCPRMRNHPLLAAPGDGRPSGPAAGGQQVNSAA